MARAGWVVVAEEEKTAKFTISPAFGRTGAGSVEKPADLGELGRITGIMRPKLTGLPCFLACGGLLSRGSLDA